MGLHTGEPHIGDEGYLGLDVVRAARIASAGVGGQILISETTRSLIGNVVPDGVAVLDLGEKHLKDVQHEHIYEVSVDGAARGYHEEEVPAPARSRSRGDELAERFEERIENYVHQQLDRALGGKKDDENASPPDHLPVRLALSGLGIAFAALLMLAVTVVVIAAVVKFIV